ncbi:MAG: histidine--tRNA ligase, partial [Patescibacteria group bacterium]
MPLTKKTAPTPKKPEGPSRKAPQPFGLVRGVRDILPADQPYWRQAFEMAQSLCDAYSVDRIETPVLEETGLFVRSVGKQTDIV